ncbi:hypothetical protein [Spirosoma pollinicola]|uniref:hypothetical protein n=1 Tax=Spirosoma pollinicola TaxID=2057025 RepID=UPI0012FE1B5F|nr:hypothetical protein [Spirosoma pollinicola]
MKTVISTGDRLRVTRLVNGYEQGYYAGAVVTLTPSQVRRTLSKLLCSSLSLLT